MLLNTINKEYTFNELKEVLAEYQYVFKSGLKSLCLWYPQIKHTYVKLPLGKHFWYDAQIIDMANRRQVALAEKLSYSNISNPYLKGFIDSLIHLKDPCIGLKYLYSCIKPYYLKKFEEHLLVTDFDLDYGTYIALESSIKFLREEIKESLSIIEALEEESNIDEDRELISILDQLWIAYQRSQSDKSFEDLTLINFCNGLSKKKMPIMVEKPARDVPTVQPKKSEMLDNNEIDMSQNDYKIAYLYANGYLELQASEIISSIMYEYFDFNWRVTFDLSRQLYDECRHAIVCFNRMEELGGYLGQYTTSFLQWDYVHMGENIAEKFIIQHRISEGTGTDASLNNVTRFRDIGDEKTAKLYEFIGADEILHVRMGNKWIEHFLPDPVEREKVIREMTAKVVSFLEKEGLPIDFLSCVPVAAEHRELAGFSSQEINEIIQERSERCD